MNINYLGHGANSQFGPVLPTALPSGQTFASSVQACGDCCTCGFEQADRNIVIDSIERISIFLLTV
jgi:hypothetical protein